MKALGHLNIIDYRFEHVYDVDTWERVMVVETDIQLDPEGEGYDAEAETSLLSFLADYLKRVRMLTRTVHPTTIRLKPRPENA